jgi:hypothetical protein
MAVVLWNFSWIDADSFRVFVLERFYRRKGDVRGWTHGVASPWPSSVSALDFVFVSVK